MGCPAEVFIGHNLLFSINVHDPETGYAIDADVPPSFRLYDSDSGATLMQGEMGKLDDANTVGYYAKEIACTAINGFAHGVSYSIYIEAFVKNSPEPGTISYGFRAIDLSTIQVAQSNVVNTTLSSAHGSGMWGNSYGTGSVPWHVLVYEDGDPIPGAQVWITSDQAGQQYVATGMTDTAGRIIFMLNPGTYWVWKSAAGFNFTNPESMTVTA
jgi:hypothetical protein